MPSGSCSRPESLHDAVHAVMAGALRLGSLIALEIDVPGAENLTMLLGTPAAAGGDLARWSVPLPHSEWFPGGVLNAIARDGDEASGRLAVDQAANLLGHLLTSDRRRQQAEALAERAIAIAAVDHLTGLGNRRAWTHALAAQQDRGGDGGVHRTSVLVLDLDGLKEVNDREGHAAGDRLLVRAADLLRSFCRRTDTLCRLGGDEFGILAQHINARDGQHLAERLRRKFHQAQVAVSIGLATVPPEATANAAWQQADLLMYTEKRARR